MDEDEDEDEQVISPARRVSIIAALRTYTGPLTKNGLPKRKDLNAAGTIQGTRASRFRAGKSLVSNSGAPSVLPDGLKGIGKERRRMVARGFNPFNKNDWNKVGDKIEDAAEDVGDAIKDTAEDVGDKIKGEAQDAREEAPTA